MLHHPFLFKGKPTRAQEVAGRPEQTGRQRRGPARNLTQTVRRNPSVGQVVDALSVGIAARKAALLNQRHEIAKGEKIGTGVCAVAHSRIEHEHQGG